MQDNLDCPDVTAMIAERLHASCVIDVGLVSVLHITVCKVYLRDGSAETIVCAATLI